MTGNIVLAIDPGLTHTGVTVSRITDETDETGAPVLEPFNGLTISKTAEEDPLDSYEMIRDEKCKTRRGKLLRRGNPLGQGWYTERVVATILDWLDDLEISDDDLALVCIEGYVTPPGKIDYYILVGNAYLTWTIGRVCEAWPVHELVMPAGKWPTQPGAAKPLTGWDNDPEAAPDFLSGRRPSYWTKTPGIIRGTHQRSAFCMGRAGWRAWNKRGLRYVERPEIVGFVPLADSAKQAAPLAPVVAPVDPARLIKLGVTALGSERSLDSLLSAARAVMPAGSPAELTDLAASIGHAVRPDGSRDELRAALAGRLAA